MSWKKLQRLFWVFFPFFLWLFFFKELAEIVIFISITWTCCLIFYFYFCLFFHVSFSRSYNACLFVFILAHINQNLTLFFRSFKAATFIYHRCFLRFVFCVSVLYFMHFYFLACLIMVMVFLCLATHNALFF
jgi:hypothetical protein